LDKDLLLASVIFDPTKAFHCVDHDILTQKLQGKLLEFQGFLTGRRQRVCLGEAQSSRCDVRRCAPQGSILGPLPHSYCTWMTFHDSLPQSSEVPHCHLSVMMEVT